MENSIIVLTGLSGSGKTYILNKIISLTKINDMNILEVGPGSGNLTSQIIKKRPKKFYVVEKDDSLCSILKKNFDDQIEIINDDILKVKENLALEIKKIVEGKGAAFAFPSQSIYVEKK